MNIHTAEPLQPGFHKLIWNRWSSYEQVGLSRSPRSGLHLPPLSHALRCNNKLCLDEHIHTCTHTHTHKLTHFLQLSRLPKIRSQLPPGQARLTFAPPGRSHKTCASFYLRTHCVPALTPDVPPRPGLWAPGSPRSPARLVPRREPVLRSSLERSGASLSCVLFDAKGHQGLLEEESAPPGEQTQGLAA